MEKTLGGDRLGSGKKMKVEMHNFERSTFNQNRKWQSTMAPGVLVPCFKEIGTNGDKFEISIKNAIRTLPTIAPLFGSFKFQCDIFAIPMRLYNGLLHNNAIKVGMKMNQVLFPTIEYSCDRRSQRFMEYEHWFSNPSSLVNYLGQRDIPTNESTTLVPYKSNAMFILAYYDIYKNYYANKQEVNAYFIGKHGNNVAQDTIANVANFYQVIVERDGQEIMNYMEDTNNITDGPGIDAQPGDKVTVNIFMKDPNLETYNFDENPWKDLGMSKIAVQKGRLKNNYIDYGNQPSYKWQKPINIQEIISSEQNSLKNWDEYADLANVFSVTFANWSNNAIKPQDLANVHVNMRAHDDIGIVAFPLANIDQMRVDILKTTGLNKCVEITQSSYYPYKALAETYVDENMNTRSNNASPMYGLALKTYQSDKFNNWLANTDNIALVNEISSVAVTDGKFTMDALIMAKKVYNMLNRIAMSGGTWEDWQEAVYGEDATNRAETPIYCGGLSCEVAFEEVVQTGTGEDISNLGNLGGKGVTLNHEGGNVIINCNEPMIIMGIASLTPRIVYSQGNYWFNSLKNIDELHKPSLDGIGFQDLLMNQMVGCTDWEDAQGVIHHNAIGKQTAWLNYQTEVDEVYGNFAQENNQMYMTLNRNYTKKLTEDNHIIVDDATTYIDPQKYNYPFAVTDLTGQNFWVQLAFDVKSRRKMSAKQIPNL